MLKSMTGFGRGEYADEKRSVVVEIRAVNHRYSDINVKMPRRYSFAEEPIKSLVKNVAPRGKIDVAIMIDSSSDEDTNIKLNLTVAKQYYENLTLLKETLNIPGDISIALLAGMPDVVKTVSNVENEEDILKSLSEPVILAVENLNKMRMAEGLKLAEDILYRGNLISDLASEIEAYAPSVSKAYALKMKERISELIDKAAAVSEERILLEAAIFADKSNITEEIVRLKSHVQQLRDIIGKSDQPVGKKLDFLVQEMNREANTIGSKANDIAITSNVLSLKSEIEKIREQVQNIE
ncbi:MAG: YicC family protein [Clostridia bacterium]|nr:YicC family protein [Clostridia bacterium]